MEYDKETKRRKREANAPPLDNLWRECRSWVRSVLSAGHSMVQTWWIWHKVIIVTSNYRLGVLLQDALRIHQQGTAHGVCELDFQENPERTSVFK